MATVISVENLGKKYIIGHQQQEPYLTLRDAIAERFKETGRRLLHPFLSSSGQPLIGLATTEEFWALKDVSFEVQQGERVGIIGRNGAGKTTLLKVLSRITEPTTGRFMIKGRVASLLEVGTGFHPELTGRENIYLNGAILGMQKEGIKKKFDEIVAFAEIEKFLDTPVKRYSSGMYVRLAFAVAAHLEPDILIVDEVLAVGDAQFQKKCLGRMEEVGKEGRTVLFVSHNMTAVQRLCPKTRWLDHGTIKAYGDTAAIVEDYLFSEMKAFGGDYTFQDGEDKDLRFIRAELLNAEGLKTNLFRADEPIRFRITYAVNRTLSGTSLAINICSASGESLWAMADWDVFSNLFEVREPGTWVYECIAPPHVLRPGRYLVALGAARRTEVYHHPAPFPLEISAHGYWRRSHKYFGMTGGPVVVPMQATRPVMIKD